jgi:hypothetical protein
VPWTEVLAHSEEISCPACHAALELSRFTRVFSGFGGVLGALVAIHLTHEMFHGAHWVMRMVTAILAFGIASAVCVLVAGDLVVRPRMTSAGFPHAQR